MKKTKIDIYEDSIDSLKDLIKIQCSDGNWNYDPYMHGMANGLILAMSLFGDKRVEFLQAPKKWLKDKEDMSEQPIAVGDKKIRRKVTSKHVKKKN